MPKREKDDRLDQQKLEHRVERCQQVSRGEVEEIKPVERQRHGDVVDDGDVDVAGVGAPVTVVVVSARLQEDDDERHDRLDEAELQRRLLAEAQEADGVSLPSQAARPVQARRLDWLASDLRHYVALTSKILVAQRQKVVNYKS